MNLGNLLTTSDIRKRYKCGRDAAAVYMRELGGFKVGVKWFIRQERLERFEMGEAAQQPTPMPAAGIKDHASKLLSA